MPHQALHSLSPSPSYSLSPECAITGVAARGWRWAASQGRMGVGVWSVLVLERLARGAIAAPRQEPDCGGFAGP